MAAKSDHAKFWKKKTVEERRARLDYLGERYTTLEDDEIREHDALATLVADDEEENK